MWQEYGKEPSYTVSENINYCNHYGNLWRFIKKLKIDLAKDLVIPLLCKYPKECKSIYKGDKHTPMFIAALFTCGINLGVQNPTTNEWMKKMWFVTQP
jgi:hypothetical protein